MDFTHPLIVTIERFGGFCDESRNVCLFCDKKITEGSEKGIIDRFGRCFCSERCKGIFYGKDEKVL